MKVLLFFEGKQILAKSGIGRALEHQKKALAEVGIEYTTDGTCTDYDILHINTYGPKSRSMIRQARRMNKKIIYHAHSTVEDFRQSFIGSNQLAPVFKRNLISLYSQADCLITPTPYSKGLLENYGIQLPIKVLSNGVDLTHYKKDASKEQLFRDYFQIKSDEKVIISVGLYFERKGIIDFIEVAKKFPSYRFIWFGQSNLYTIPRKIRKLVRDHGLSNVEFPGYIRGDIIEGAYMASDLFFFPSFEETEGIVVLEALASRQQVLVRDIPVYQGWLESGLNCYKGKNVKEFASLIQGILNEELTSTQEKGFQVAAKRDLLDVGVGLKEIYIDVLAEKNLDQRLSVY